MKKGVIIELKNEYTYVLLPKGKMKKIKREYNHEIGKEISISLLSPTKILSLALVSCMIIIAIIVNPFQKITPIQALSYVTMSVNPGLVLKVNEKNKIVAVSYTNQEGELLTQKVKFVNKTLDESVILFIDYCFENNYFQNNNKIDVNVISDDQNQIKNVEQQVQNLIQEYLKEHQMNVTIKIDQVSQTQKEDAQNLGIPDSKVKLIDLVLKYYPHLSKEQLAHESVDDLIDYLEDCGYDEELLDKMEDTLEDQKEEKDDDDSDDSDDNDDNDEEDDDDEDEDDNDDD